MSTPSHTPLRASQLALALFGIAALVVVASRATVSRAADIPASAAAPSRTASSTPSPATSSDRPAAVERPTPAARAAVTGARRVVPGAVASRVPALSTWGLPVVMAATTAPTPAAEIALAPRPTPERPQTAAAAPPLRGVNGAPIQLPGFTLSLSDITDLSTGTAGMRAAQGVRTHTLVDATLDLEQFMGWKGATLFAQHKMKRGANGSGAAGLMQNHSNIDADDFRAAGEVWLEQRLFHDVVRIKAGRLDFNTEFAGTDNGVAFLNASMGYSPAIAAAPTFPLPITAANVFVTPREGTTVSAGAFDGRDGAPAAAGSTTRFYIGQFSQSWTRGDGHAFDGRISVGRWQHTGMFMAADATDDAEPSIRGAGGWYGTVDLTLWRGAPLPGASEDDAAPSAALFAQVGRGNPRIASVDVHQGLGVTTTGLVPHRRGDLIGVGVTHASWTGGRETISEAFYQAPLTSHFTVVADLQRVGHFDALGRRVGFIPNLRTIVTF